MPAIWTFAKVKPEKENQTNGIRELGPDPPPLLEQEKDDLLSLPPTPSRANNNGSPLNPLIVQYLHWTKLVCFLELPANSVRLQ